MRAMRRWRLGLLAGVALTGCRAAEQQQASGPPDVEVSVARAEDVRVDVPTVASLDARRAADLRAQVAGAIAQIVHDEGSGVAAGMSLLTIDPDRYRLGLQSAVARYEQASAQFLNDSLLLERSAPLLATGGIGRQSFDDLVARAAASKAARDQASAARDIAAQDRDNSTVRAPFAGRFAERRVNVGDYVRVGDVVGSIADAAVLLLTFDLPETQGVHVEPGDPVTFEATALPDRTFTAVVYYVSPIVTEATRTMTVKARVDNRDGALRPGMSATAHVATAVLEGAAVVPEVAVRREAGEQYVFRVAHDTARRVSVELGPRPRAGDIVVTAGLRAGDSVLVAGFQKITDGSVVRPKLVAAVGDTGATR
jgi:membrane fusion protein (multidrug efflux system)